MSDLYLEPYVEIASGNNSSELVEPIVAIGTRTRLREDEVEHIVRPMNALSVLDRQRFFNAGASMGIEEFMHLSSGMNRQVSDDILQHILGCVYDNSSDQLSPVFVNNSCEPVPGDIRISTDIDSFAYVSSDLPLKHSCTLDIRPPYSSSYTTDTGVAWSHERYTNDVKVGVHKISNVQFLHSERLQVAIFFPGIYREMVQTESARPSYFIPVLYHERFVNMVLLPALDIIFDTSVVPVPLDYQSAADFGLGKGISLSMEEVSQLISAMRGILSRNSSLSAIFGDFFFVTWGMGMKSRFVADENFVHALSSQGFIWDKMDLSNLYLDLGINFASPQLGLTGLWSTGERKDFQSILELLFEDESFHKSMYRHDPFCGHSGIGGFKYGNRKSGFIRVSAYSHAKQPFYSRSTYGERHGKDFDADDVFKVSPGFIKHVARMKHCLSLMKYKSYGVRLEVRFTANHWDALYNQDGCTFDAVGL
ncbi:hypothetical protein RO3G_16733 [Rhizopus delemar RA 99-880]|uniref:Uncharacterized protein n=1 Tax=Rhizopus delemar (strain RA 99-880 / ATCC MYA-4621 / FGSC 9543 / NRRL 43880) TaxID=246409 RepID=I1CU92_RHIO9|nr:hypothetical protein RO3G_16733 [Rhizopus delemar RA 99-880]|eukprot:EIE92022.1 hypothetical protein RO3G_16733 [Rhizopus delemar RA 99-880]